LRNDFRDYHLCLFIDPPHSDPDKPGEMETPMTSVPIHCPGCRAPLGRVIEIKERIYFDDGLMLVADGSRRCHCCGRVFYWQSRNYSMLDVVRQFGPPIVEAGVGM
jgi:hypothetical protein